MIGSNTAAVDNWRIWPLMCVRRLFREVTTAVNSQRGFKIVGPRYQSGIKVNPITEVPTRKFLKPNSICLRLRSTGWSVPGCLMLRTTAAASSTSPLRGNVGAKRYWRSLPPFSYTNGSTPGKFHRKNVKAKFRSVKYIITLFYDLSLVYNF